MLLKEIVPSSVMQDLIAYFTNIFNPKYKVYSALITQFEEFNPTVVVLENTIGEITFTRTAQGTYSIQSSGLFTTEKTFITFGSPVINAGIPAFISIPFYLLTTSTIEFLTTSYSLVLEDNYLENTPLEIRVYY